jgi:hypothetical protein
MQARAHTLCTAELLFSSSLCCCWLTPTTQWHGTVDFQLSGSRTYSHMDPTTPLAVMSQIPANLAPGPYVLGWRWGELALISTTCTSPAMTPSSAGQAYLVARESYIFI